MRAERVIARGQKRSEARMTDTAEVGYSEPGTVLDENGDYQPVFTAVYSGPCRFKAGNTAVNQIDAANQQLVEQTSTLKFPMATSVGIKKDMIVRFLTSETDPALPGTVARIEGPSVGSYRTSRRFSVEVVS